MSRVWKHISFGFGVSDQILPKNFLFTQDFHSKEFSCLQVPNQVYFTEAARPYKLKRHEVVWTYFVAYDHRIIHHRVVNKLFGVFLGQDSRGATDLRVMNLNVFTFHFFHGPVTTCWHQFICRFLRAHSRWWFLFCDRDSWGNSLRLDFTVILRCWDFRGLLLASWPWWARLWLWGNLVCAATRTLFVIRFHYSFHITDILLKRLHREVELQNKKLTCKISVLAAASSGDTPSLFLLNKLGCLCNKYLKQSLCPYSAQKWHGVLPSISFALMSAPAISTA